MTWAGTMVLALAGTTPLLMAAPPKILVVVAHPDDEYYFAGTIYRLAQELGSTVDQVVITNGEGGYRYSTLAEKIYGVSLTDEATGRRRLPEIRRKETLNAGRILGIRHHHFLEEKDQRFTLDAYEALDRIWDRQRILRVLDQLIVRERYDFVFTVAPRASTHGHHQAATLLALEAVASLDLEDRPVVLAAEPQLGTHPEAYNGLDGFPLTRPLEAASSSFRFDRRRRLGHEGALRYDIVVNWVISEHKSQGQFQNDVGRHDVERFWTLRPGPPDAVARVAALDQLLNARVAVNAGAANLYLAEPVLK